MKTAAYAGLVIDGVTSVFKRFFNDECELQVLLSDDFASSLWVRPAANFSVLARDVWTSEKLLLWQSYKTDGSASMDHFNREEV
eukprot:COSAG02_NODE_2387_length_8986_cov_12.395184_3_plen_84_part_00